MIFGDRQKLWESANARFKLEVDHWSQAVGNGESRDAAAALQAMRKEWATMKQQYPAEALELLPALWSCPMHSELIARSAGSCPVSRHATRANLRHATAAHTGTDYPRRNRRKCP